MAAFIKLLLPVAVVIFAGANGYVLSSDDPEVLKVANYAIRAYNQMTNNAYAYKLIAIQSASAQMSPPAREKYSLSVTVGQTVCRNRPDIKLADCSLHGQTMTCNFVVLAVPNLDVPSYLLSHQCN